MSITFGSDPEFLITNKGVPKSAIGVVQGSPDNRIEINGHEFYYDNVLAECAIKPSKTKEETIFNFREALQIYVDMVKPFNLTTVACAEFPVWELEHEKAKEVGCAPDWCAYELKLKDPPKEAIQSSALRSCGGHVHIGSEILASDGPEPILSILMLDLFLGVPSVWLDKDPNSVTRRKIYGRAGRYRPKDYGIEYRSLSNFWLNSPELVMFVYDISTFVVDLIESKRAWELWTFNEEVFFESENLSDAWECKNYDPYCIVLGINTGNRKCLSEGMRLIMEYLPSKLFEELNRLAEEPQDNFYKNWDLK